MSRCRRIGPVSRIQPRGAMRCSVKVLIAVFILSLLLTGCPVDEKFIFFPSAAIESTPQPFGVALAEGYFSTPPGAAIESTPKRFGVDYEDVYFTTRDGVKLNGWLALKPGAQATLLWFHGNAGNIGHRADGLKPLRDKLSVNVFIIDYRGYGRSEGVVSEQGTYEDAGAAFRYLTGRSDIDKSEERRVGKECRYRW